jgi:hypothetical protein
VGPLKTVEPAVIALLTAQRQDAAPALSWKASGYDEESGLPLDWIDGYRKLVIICAERGSPFVLLAGA